MSEQTREWDEQLALLAVYENRSQCARRHVACIITDDKYNIMGIGWNYNPTTGGPCDSTIPRKCGCVHAEVMALLKMRHDIRPSFAIISCAPCMLCFKALYAAGIRGFIYKEDSDPGFEVIEYINKNKVGVLMIKVTQNVEVPIIQQQYISSIKFRLDRNALRVLKALEYEARSKAEISHPEPTQREAPASRF